MQVNYQHIVPGPGEKIEYVEKAKDSRPEADDDQLSQPSTLHSLSHLDATPEKTPVSADLQKGWSGIKDEVKHKASEFKGKLTEKFGEQIQPEKDLDGEVKEQIKEINEEIKQQPHGEEEVVEGQGQACEGKKGSFEGLGGAGIHKIKDISQGIVDKAVDKIGELKEKVGQQEQTESGSFKSSQESHEHHQLTIESESFKPTSETHLLMEKVEEALEEEIPLTEAVEEIEHEKGSQAEGQDRQPALDKIQQGAQKLSDKFSGKVEEIKGKLSAPKLEGGSESKESGEAPQFDRPPGEERIDIRQSQLQGQPVLEKVQQGIKDASSKLSGKAEEIKGKFSAPKQEEGGFREERPEGQEQLQKDFRSEEKQPAFDKMQQGLKDASSKLSGKAEEIKGKFSAPKQEEGGFREERSEGQEQPQKDFRSEEGQSRSEQPQSGEKQPVLEKVQQGMKDASSKLSGKAGEIKEKLSAPKQEEGGFREERSEGQEQPQKDFRSEEGQSQSEEKQPALEKMQQGMKDASSKLSGKAEEIKSKLSESKEEKPQESSESQPQPQEKESSAGSIKQSIQEASDKISDKVQDVKDSISQKKDESSDNQQQEQPKERQPLVDQIMGRIQAVNDNFHQRVQDVKDAFKVEERTDDRQPLIDVVSGRIHGVTEKISHGIEAVKSRARPSHEKDMKQEETEETEEAPEIPQSDSPQESGPSLRQKVSGKFQNISSMISQNIGNVKEKIHSVRQGDGTKKFHKVDENEGFPSETVQEYREEKRLEELGGHELVSENPFEPISAAPEGLDKQSYLEKFKGRFRKEKEGEVPEDEIIRDVAEDVEQAKEEGHGLKERLSQNLGNLKEKFHFGKKKVEEEAGEKLEESEPLEQAKETLKEEEPLAEAEKQGSRLKDAISHNMESLKGKFHFGKKQVEEAGEKLEESQPLEQAKETLKEEEPSAEPVEQGSRLKDAISQNMESLKGKFNFGKKKAEEAGEKLEESEPLEKAKEATEALKNDNALPEQLEPSEEKPLDEQPSEPLKEQGQTLKQRIAGGLHNIQEKISHNVDSFKGRFKKEQGQGEEIENLDEPEEPVQEEESQPVESEKPSLNQRILGGFELLKNKIAPGKGKSEEKEGEQKPEEFHVVTEGTVETVSELKEEERMEPLLSNNPFEPLETKDTNLVQPLEGTELVGGDLKELTAEEKPGFKVEEEPSGNEENTESKSLFQKAKAGFLSTFSRKNKENVE